MLRTTLAAAALAAFAVPASANQLLLGYTGQIRAQSAVVRAQAEATFAHCLRARRIADDICDELDDLCRDLDRVEEQLSRPIVSRHGVRRLERLLKRLDDEACEVEEAVREALDDARELRPVGYHQSIVAPAPTTHLVSHRGVSVSLRGGRFHVAFGQPAARPVSHHVVASPTLVTGVPAPAEAALCHEARRLRRMTKQLLAIVCG